MLNKNFGWMRGFLKNQVPDSLVHQSSFAGRHESYASFADGVNMKSLFTVVIAGTHYLLHPQKLGSIEETINPDALIPVTLLDTTEIYDDLEGVLRLFDTVDDVFLPEFGNVLVEKPDRPAGGGSSAARTQTSKSGAKAAYTLSQPEVQAFDFEGLPSGPYFLHGPNLYQAWRLYDDNLDAFTFGVIPESINGSSDAYEALSSLSDNGSFKSIAVPSRLYHPAPSIRKPLSGLRMSITDAMSLKGVQTTLSSRSWTQLYDTEAATTADYVQKLIDMGAVIVGKTKSSQFDSGREWVDIEAPWNPRGDGYQDSSWSAAGAGASLSGYSWLQYSVAQDALEGVREQSNVHGLYSIRSSAGSASLNGWQISSPHYDSAGLLSRDINDLLKLAQSALTISNTNATLPKRLIYPLDFYPVPSKEHQELDDKFVATLEKSLGVKAERISLSEIWAKKPPTESSGKGLQEYMQQAPFGSFCYDFYHEYDEFRKSYRSKFGRGPYAEATPRFRWNTGEKMTKEDYDGYLKRIEVFKKWFGESVMPIAADSQTVMILPFGSDETTYRDDPPRKPTSIEGITSELLSPLLGTPQIVVPFAQVPYHSRISGSTEFRSVCGSLMGPKGSDVMLIQLVKQAFEKARWRSKVDTGRSAFPQNYRPA